MNTLIDPTTYNQQGNDIGTQYRSAIFYHSPEQKEIAEKVTAEVQEKHYKGKKIATQIVPASKFYDAEEYHQVIKMIGLRSQKLTLIIKGILVQESYWISGKKKKSYF